MHSRFLSRNVEPSIEGRRSDDLTFLFLEPSQVEAVGGRGASWLERAREGSRGPLVKQFTYPPFASSLPLFFPFFLPSAKVRCCSRLSALAFHSSQPATSLKPRLGPAKRPTRRQDNMARSGLHCTADAAACGMVGSSTPELKSYVGK